MSCTPETSMKQASMTANEYLGDVLKILEERKLEPNAVLVSAMLNVCALDYLATRIESSLEMLSNSVGYVTDIATAIEKHLD